MLPESSPQTCSSSPPLWHLGKPPARPCHQRQRRKTEREPKFPRRPKHEPERWTRTRPIRKGRPKVRDVPHRSCARAWAFSCMATMYETSQPTIYSPRHCCDARSNGATETPERRHSLPQFITVLHNCVLFPGHVVDVGARIAPRVALSNAEPLGRSSALKRRPLGVARCTSQ